MSIDSISRRLDKLDALRPAETRRRVIRLIAQEDGQTQADAIARWCAEHADEAPPGQPDDFIILHSIVSPKRGPDGEPLQ